MLLLFVLELYVLLGVDVRNVPVHKLTMLQLLVQAETGPLLELFGAAREVAGIGVVLRVSVDVLS